MYAVLIVIGVIVLLWLLARPREKPDPLPEGSELEPSLYGLNWPAVERCFPYKVEISRITLMVSAFLDQEREIFRAYPPLVNPYAFALAVRQAEGGRAGREFGVMHPDALDTGFDVQCEWFLHTFRNDTRRWHTNQLIHVGGRTRADFVDWISYFSQKYAPTQGATNDPTNLNQYHEPNVRRLYALYNAKE